MKALPRILFLLLAVPLSQATPVNKAALKSHYGGFLSAELNRCATCHLPSANREPASLEEFPHNPFGDRLRSLRSKNPSIAARLALIAKEDSDQDGVKNEIEILLGHNPGDPKDKPTDVSKARAKQSDFAKFLASYKWRPFDPVQQPAEPRVKNRSWVRTPIDAFLAAEHQKLGLTPRPEAPKDVLLRRVYLDLIGLAPTPEEIAAFEKDTSPKAYEKVVDRLLADQRYGERWARHWMDVWRYSDWAGWSGGNQIRDSKPHIWRWRDWIIESLNNDKPYDRMVTEMLAADEAAPTDTKALRATGFLVRNYKMLSREQWLEDTVKHTSQAFLGVTMGCAKCHDHMFDPISQAEYYKFRAIFEPHQVRTDRLPGQTDTAKDGLVRVFDIATNAPTYFFIRGDERKPDTNRVMAPGVPRFLHGDFQLEKINLPRDAAFPDKRPFVIADLIAESEGAVKKADDATRELAQAKHDNLLAQLEAEDMVKDSDAWKSAAKKASRAQQRIALLEAKSKFAKEKSAESEAEKKSTENDDAKKKFEAAKKSREEAEKKVAEAEGKLAAEATTEFQPRKAEEFPDTSTGRRLALARWIASTENPLTARVAINHIWLRSFGQPLVPNPADFGANSRPPANPALVDYLAAQFMNTGWSMKSLHRQILLSAAYRMASTPDPKNLALDPDNTRLWRMPSRRMEAEIVRDNLLHISGELDPAMGGPDIDHTQGLTSKRRSIYLRSAAEKEVEFLKIFDGPSVTECYMRHPSVAPQQALALANSDLALKQAANLAQKISTPTDSEFVRAAYLRVLSREPNAEETKLCAEFLATEKTDLPRARRNLLLVLLNHNDFVTIR